MSGHQALQLVLVPLLAAALGLFLLKVMWNVLIPYALLRRKLRGEKSQRISMMPIIEAIPLVFALVISALGGPYPWPWNPAAILLVGSALVIGSYLHMCVFISVARFFLGRRNRAPGFREG